jgi:hypothetical protein
MNSQPPVPATPAPVTAGAIPFYKSPIYLSAMGTVLGALTTLYPKAAAAIGINTPAGAAAFIELVGAGMTLAGGAIIWIVRQVTNLQRVTLTQKAANADPSTRAVVQVQAAMKAAGIPTAVELQKTIAASSVARPPEIPNL